MKTDKEIYEFVKGHYYCDEDDDGARELWEPFENYPEEEIKQFIENDIIVLKKFMKEDRKRR